MRLRETTPGVLRMDHRSRPARRPRHRLALAASDDGGTVHICEKYTDSEAMVSHVSGFMAKWAERFLAAVDVTRFTVYGSPNAAAKEMLDGFGAVYLGPWGGFSR